MKQEINFDEITNFCKRKGFVFPSGDLYGSFAGFCDFGNLGVELKNNIKSSWWNFYVRQREDVIGLDGAIITNPKVWEASGHVDCFLDYAVECKKCSHKFKVDKAELKTAKCEKCGGEIINKGEFNPMFITEVGPIKEDSIKSYLRPETAQLIFANFKNILDTNRLKLPFGVAQIGKSFRNEIAPRNFLFRLREFEQMEIEYFINPKEKRRCPYEIQDLEVLVYSAEMQEKKKEPEKMKLTEALKKGIIKLSWHAYWLSNSLNWFKENGANLDNFRIRQHEKNELAHYSSDCWDIEYKFPFGYKELQGIADRGTYDLTSHQNKSSKSLELLEEETKEKILPMVICEPSFGVERTFLVYLLEAYSKNDKGEVILKLHPRISPIKVAIFPLVKKDEELVKKAREIYYDLRKEFNCIYDEKGSVGRRYARNDEIGTPYCIVTDTQTLEDNTATIRNRNDGKQIRINIEKIKDTIRKLINQEMNFEESGILV
jgi:glycyl-tRNA synthetase